jgi:hypothetical protein
MAIRNEDLEQILAAIQAGGTPFNPTTDINIERLYDGESLLASQQPSTIDTPLEIQFGVVQGGPSDPIQTIANVGSEASILRINTPGTYRIKTAIQYGRTGASGTSILNFRVKVAGSQAGRSINQRISNSNETSIFTDEAWITFPVAPIDIVYEVIRDSNGNDSGGLFAGEVSGSTGWNASPSCALRVERWIGS